MGPAGNPKAVIEKLQEAPVDRQLPYVERVPVTREGTIHLENSHAGIGVAQTAG